MRYSRKTHAATKTDDYTFNQLIPYIGNKRKLLPLISQALQATGLDPASSSLLDIFAGTGVVSRHAKTLGFAVMSNDWEPYSEQINICYIEGKEAPRFFDDQSYTDVLAILNNLPDREDWITLHLCPDDDKNYDVKRDRMFYTRRNGLRFDAMRHQIGEWQRAGLLDRFQMACLIAPMMYAASYNSNTSGVFKGFHNGWGGQTGTALDRILGSAQLRPATFFDNGRQNRVFRSDATRLATELAAEKSKVDIVYIDPPYNQPQLSRKISGHGDKSAIRLDWRTERRSKYNHRKEAAQEYSKLINALDVGWTATSYSTDGTISIEQLVQANAARGRVSVFHQGYKRYRVSTQRPSEKPMNIEFVLLTEFGKKNDESVEAICHRIRSAEHEVLSNHPEIAIQTRQFSLID